METEERIDSLIDRWEDLQRCGTPLTIEDLCSECPELAAEIRRRIALLKAIGSALDTPEAERWPTAGERGPDAAAAHRPPEVVRATAVYRTGSHHRHGGLGVVFTAHQQELDRTVALKRIRPDKLHDAARRRFLREAALTARLQHPGIVPIYGLGEDDDGPFYAMPLIQGRTLQEAIEAFHGDEALRRDAGRRRLRFRELLQQFVAACNTVAYAHDQGVVHRDLKPSNLMLGPYGETLVLDWGLAKRVGDEDATSEPGGEAPSPGSSSEELTATGVVLGTPQYMSPEQARGEPAGPAGDIFGLGLVLYAILTGRSAFDESSFRGADPLKAVREAAIVPPRRRDPSLPRALEAICLRALAGRAADRYVSARALAEDVTRWLADEPVTAWREPVSVRARRWARRNRTAVTAAATAGLIGLAAVAGVQTRANLRLQEANVATNLALDEARAAKQAADRERERAEGNLVLARQVVEEMYSQVAEELAQERKLPDYQRKILEKALKFYETTALPQSGDPRLRLMAGQTSTRVAIIRQYLGEMDKAEAAFRQALELLGPLAAERLDVPEYARSLAVVYSRLAQFYGVWNRYDQAVAAQEESVATSERLAARHPEVVQYRSDLVDDYNNLALYYRITGRPDEAVAVHRKNVALSEALAAEHPQDTNIRVALARGFLVLGEACKVAGRSPEATAAFRRGAEHYEALTEGHPLAPRDHRGQAIIHCNLGCCQAELGHFSVAAAALLRAVEHCEAAASAQPEDAQDRDALSSVNYDLASIYHRAGRRAEAEPPYRRARALREKLVAERPEVSVYRSELAKYETGLGTLLVESGRAREAEPMLKRAEENLERLIREDPKVAEYREPLAAALGGLGKLYRESGRTAEAMRAFRRAREVLEKSPPLGGAGLYHLAGVQAQCAALRTAAGERPTEDEEAGRRGALDRAMDTLRRAVAAGFQDADRLRQDTNLDPLRSRADFRMLRMDLEFPSDPFPP
jgi:serine/threonine-protein kinase